MYLVCGARGVHECFGACRCFVISIAVWHVSVVTREAEHFSSKGRPTKAAATRQAGWELVATAWTCLRAERAAYGMARWHLKLPISLKIALWCVWCGRAPGAVKSGVLHRARIPHRTGSAASLRVSVDPWSTWSASCNRLPLENDRLVFRSFYPRPRRQHRTTHADLGCSAMLAACAAQPQLSVLWGREHNDKPWWRGLNTHVTS